MIRLTYAPHLNPLPGRGEEIILLASQLFLEPDAPCYRGFRVTVPVWTNWYCVVLKRLQFTS
jgi:hypothetical protein